ncbi:hypothetical protein L3Q82_021138, partial [Scortum barcoo]
EQVVKPVVSVYPAASRAHLEGKSSLLCVASAMFPPLVQFSWKRQKEDGPLEELPPAEGEQLELRESGRTAAILLIRQPESSTYKYRCYVQHEGDTQWRPPQNKANVQEAQRKLAQQILCVERTKPDSLFIVLGDFEKAHLSHQVHAIPHAALGHSDHVMVHLVHSSAQTIRSLVNKMDEMKLRDRLCKDRQLCGDRYRDLAGYWITTSQTLAVELAALSLLRAGQDYCSLRETQRWSRTRPTTRTVQVWTEEASSALQDCFECTDWEVFKEGTDLDGYTSSVLSYLKFCTDAVLPTKTIKVFPKSKTMAGQHSEAPTQSL